MSEREPTQGLTCPNCGGVVPVPEGQAIVQCPYCDLRSIVRGDRGLRRYQVPQKTPQENALGAFRKFLSSSLAIARDTSRQAQLTETFLVYLPFWNVWSRVVGWAFGEEKVGSGDDAHYEPREVRLVQEMTWNGAACDVGEFGVTQVPQVERVLEPFDPDEMHKAGMVFEPVGSASDARHTAEEQFQEQVRSKTSLDRLAQLFVRHLQRRFALVYHPLWVMRYLYRGRAFQVVVDAYSGKVLYGKAPGNTLYRAAVLVLGMAIGALVAVDGPSLILSSLGNSDDGLGALAFAFIVLAVGIGIMIAAYRAFRYGEQYEFRSGGPKKIAGLENPMEMVTQVKDVEKWISRLS